MTRIVIGAALSIGLLATAACSGSSPAAPSASSSSSASPSATAFQAQTLSASPFDAGTWDTLASHEHQDTSAHEGRGRAAQLEGTIASIDAAHKSFMVRTITVTVSDTTVIRHGHTVLLFADLKVGDRVHVKGAAGGTTIAASEVKLQREDKPDQAEAGGVVSALAGACPAITFTLGTAHVATDATTVFRHGACADVTNGVRVEVKGARTTDGTIQASRVSIEAEGDD